MDLHPKFPWHAGRSEVVGTKVGIIVVQHQGHRMGRKPRFIACQTQGRAQPISHPFVASLSAVKYILGLISSQLATPRPIRTHTSSPHNLINVEASLCVIVVAATPRLACALSSLRLTTVTLPFSIEK